MGKKGKDQRTKNNARPSNSGRSAELLGNSTFFGFSASKDTPSGFATEEIDSSVDPNFSLLLKKMTKKDATTKLKALQEFSELVKATDVETLKAVLPFWPRAFCSLAGDADHRVREAVHQTQGQVVAKAGRNIAPHLKQIIAAWFVGQCDCHAPAASAARASLAAAFPGTKMADALAFCQLEILAFLSASLNAPPPPKSEEGDAIALYHRRLSSSLQGYALYLRALPAAKLEPAIDANREMVASKAFKKLAKFAAPQVCAAWFSAAAALCTALPALATEQAAALSAALVALDERDSAALAAAWEAALCLACAVPDCWSHVSLEKAVLPKLWHVLREGCYGNAGTILPNLLPLISKIPVGDEAKAGFYEKLFDNLRSGSRCRGVLASRGETGAVVRCYLECLGFCLMRAQDDSALCSRLIHAHLGSLVVSTLTLEPVTALSAALAPALSGLVRGWEVGGRTEWADAALGALASAATPGPDWALARQVDVCLAMLAPPRAQAAGCRVRFQLDAGEPAAAKPSPRPVSAGLRTLLCTVGAALAHVTRAEQTPRALPQLARLLDAAGPTLADFMHTVRVPPPPLPPPVPATGTTTQRGAAPEPTSVVASDVPTLRNETVTRQEDVTASDTETLDRQKEAVSAESNTVEQHERVSNAGDSALDEANGAETEERATLALLACAWLSEQSICGGDAIRVALAALPHLADDEHRKVAAALEGLLPGALAAPCLTALAARCPEAGAARILRGAPAGTALRGLLHSVCAGGGEPGEMHALEACISARDVEGGAVLSAETLRDFGDVAGATASTAADPAAADVANETALRLLALLSEASADDRLLPPLLSACLARPALASAWRALAAGAQRSTDVPALVRRAEVELRRPVDSLPLSDLPRYVEAAWLVTGQSQAGVDPLLDRLATRLQPIEARLAPLGVPQGIGLEPLAPSTENYPEDFSLDGLSLTRCLEVYLNHALFAVCLVQRMLPEVEQDSTTAEDMKSKDTLAEDDDIELEMESVVATEDIKCDVVVDESLPSSAVCESGRSTADASGLPTEGECVDPKSVNCSEEVEKEACEVKSGSERFRAQDADDDADDCLLAAEVRRHFLRAQACAALCHTLKTTYATSVHTAALAGRLQRFQLEFQRLVLAAPRAQARHALTAWLEKPTSLLRGCLEDDRLAAAVAASSVLALRAGVVTAGPVDQVDFPGEHEMPSKSDMLYNCEVWRKSRAEVAAVAGVARRLTSWMRAQTASRAEPPTTQMDLVFVSLASWCETVRSSQRYLLAEQAGTLPLLPIEQQPEAAAPDGIPRAATTDKAAPDDNAAVLTIHTCRLATALFRYLALPTEQPDDVAGATAASGGPADGREAQAADWKAVFAADVTALLENTFVLLADACVRGDLSLLDLPLVGAVCEAVRGLPAGLPAAAAGRAALPAIACRVPELQIAAAAMLAPPSASVPEEERAAVWRSTLEALAALEPVVRDALEGVRRGQNQRFGLHDAHAAEVRGFLLVWAAALRTCDAADPELRSALATDLREGGHIGGLLTHVFRLMPTEVLHGAKPRSCAALFDSAPELEPATCGERAVGHLACHVFALALAALPAEVRGWWQSERCCSLVERVTTRHAAHALVERQMRQVAARAAREPLHNMTIRVLSGARELSAVYTVDESKTELLITLPLSYPLQPVKVEAPGGVASSAQSRAWLMQLALFLTCQNGSLWDGLSMWKAKLDKRFDGVEECYICFAVLSGAGCQLPKVCCRTCKKKFHSACLFKWFTTSNKSTCPICRNLF